MSKESEDLSRDCVCFTSGLKGGPFAAGVIHAYLAADRPAPAVVAGISVGALSAAAMQRCYRELNRASTDAATEREALRWGWYRRYLRHLTKAPFDVLWDAVPDPVDLASGRPPVRDASCPTTLRVEETGARRRYFMLTQLGRWLARLPVKISTVARLAVAFVQHKEQYGGSRLRLWCSYHLARILVGTGVLYHVARSPQWIDERPFRQVPQHGLISPKLPLHPLFGWTTWMAALVAVLALPALLLSFALLPFSSAPLVVVVIALLFPGLVLKRLKRRPAQLTDKLEISHGLLSDYFLHRRLHELFAEESLDSEPKIDTEPSRLLVVAAPLNSLEAFGEDVAGHQVWAGRGADLVESLRAALAFPGLFAPLHLTGSTIDDWLVIPTGKQRPEALDLVDGSVVRSNPIPAQGKFLRSEKNRAIAASLESEPGDPRIHVIYNVPIQPVEPAKNERREHLNIVDVAQLSLEIAARRDTQMECLEANFLSQVEHELFSSSSPTSGKGVLKLFVDEIAPEKDLTFQHPLAPTRAEILTHAASGCRRTLERLYSAEIGSGTQPCRVLIAKVARARLAGSSLQPSPGLPEICEHCSGQLGQGYGVKSAAPRYVPSYGQQDPALTEYRHLSGEEPRIVFLASGGVFRGATHIGVLAALRAAEIRPDMVVGASVGALIGGALGAISVLDDEPAFKLLGELVDTFDCVDQRIALTRRLKNAARHLGARAKQIELSPEVLGQLIRRGTRSDPGFAATGAPPALIDALSQLTLVPNFQTRSVAREFLAGHYSRAVSLFLSHIKKESLRRLDIQYEVMGTSLLAQAAFRLLGGDSGIDLERLQPFHRSSRKVSFFCTASRLDNRSSVLLGRDVLPSAGRYDFLQAVLASSAFPAVFSPRSEDFIFPGSGREDVLFSDGGMFDNLPFYPAIEVLERMQLAWHEADRRRSPLEALHHLYRQPVLFIAAALDAYPTEDTDKKFENTFATLKRSTQLKKNLKINWYEGIFDVLDRQLHRYFVESSAPAESGGETFLTRIVHAGVLKVIPTDSNHLNPTFAFCASTGLKRERVQLAIADGCFQTFLALAKAQRPAVRSNVLQHSLATLRNHRRLPLVSSCFQPAQRGRHDCPFFALNHQPFHCPFLRAAEVGSEPGSSRAVHRACTNDPAHIEIAQKAA